MEWLKNLNEKGTKIESWMKATLIVGIITALATVIGLFKKAR